MRRTRLAFASIAALAALGVGAIGSCAEVLGISDPFPDVATELCKCDLEPSLDTRWPGQTCNEHVSAALDADPEAAATWLELFDSAGCQSCGAAETCARAEPLCAAQGEPCSRSHGCCGYDVDQPSAAYCGPTDVTEGIDGTCVSDAPTCKGPFEQCGTDAECCGAAGGLGACVKSDNKPTGVCLIGCTPDYDDLCPGCCAVLTSPTGMLITCATGTDVSCETLCADNGDCDDGTSCLPTPIGPDNPVSLLTCVPD